MADRLPPDAPSGRDRPADIYALPPADVDGRRLLRQAVRFGRELRAAGIATDLGAAIDFARSLSLVDIGQREEVRAAGSAVFVRRRDDRDTYEAVFARFWRSRWQGFASPPGPLARPQPDPIEEGAPSEGSLDGGEDSPSAYDEVGLPQASDEDGDEDADTPIEGFIIAPDAYSAAEVLRHREFDRMTGAELRDAERLIDLLEPRLERRRTRRYELHRRGRVVAPRAMFRRNLATGGEIAEWVWRRPTRRPRQIVVLCDISGSMERQSRLLLRFIQALASTSAVRTESFVFGTRLTRVTRLLRERDRDRSLKRVAESVNDWAGGTRIGSSFREFNVHWARRVLRTSGVVIVVSDGWDRGDPALVAAETARLRRNCHRLIWLNPLAGTAGYEPLAAGMRAALPFVDDFVAAGTLASLERLGELLADGTGGRPRVAGRPRRVGIGGGTERGRGAGDARGLRSGRLTPGVPRPVPGGAADRAAAQPLRWD